MTTPMEEERYGIAFFDLETTIPSRPGQGYAILEFGSILVCPRKLVELDSYSTLVRPSDLFLITEKTSRCNGITRDAVASAPSFADIADKVYDLLDGRVWAGHNILRFDCPRLKEAFQNIGRPAPEPKGCIDTLTLLTQRFGRRAGNMKMASLASYFGLGQQIHRSLEDVRMNLEVVKYCATVLFLESSLPDILTTTESQFSLRTRSTNREQQQQVEATMMATSAEPMLESQLRSPMEQALGGRILDLVQRNTSEAEPFNMSAVSDEIRAASAEGVITEDKSAAEPSDASPSAPSPQGYGSSSPFLVPDQVYIHSITASLVPIYGGYQRVKILHRDATLKLQCINVKVRSGVSKKFLDQAGRPRLNILVDAPPNICQVLDACDSCAKSFFESSGTTSEWRPVVSRKNGYWNSPTIRLQIPTIATGDVAKYGTEICHKETSSGVEQRLLFSRFDPSELESLFVPGVFLDAYISLEPYDYLQNAGIRLVAEKLVVLQK